MNCPDCLDAWRVHGVPQFIIRRGETPEDFRRRTQVKQQ